MGRRAKEGFPEEVNETSRNIELVQEEKKKKKRMRVLLAKGMAYAKIDLRLLYYLGASIASSPPPPRFRP